MKGKKHTPQQIIRKLRDGEADLAAGLSISEIARKSRSARRPTTAGAASKGG
jgi:hypothetical protein